jgi:hypothetical protein
MIVDMNVYAGAGAQRINLTYEHIMGVNASNGEYTCDIEEKIIPIEKEYFDKIYNELYDSLSILSTDMPVTYFTEEFLEKAIKKGDTFLSEETIIFDRSKVLVLLKDGLWSLWMDGLWIYYVGRLFYGSDTLKRYIEYGNYNILLVTQEIGDVEYVRDYLILEKQNPETHLSNGAVEINGEYGDWEVDIVVNHHWQGRFTDDISQAFKVNPQTKKIEPFIYDTIRLYSED